MFTNSWDVEGIGKGTHTDHQFIILNFGDNSIIQSISAFDYLVFKIAIDCFRKMEIMRISESHISNGFSNGSAKILLSN